MLETALILKLSMTELSLDWRNHEYEPTMGDSLVWVDQTVKASKVIDSNLVLVALLLRPLVAQDRSKPLK